MVEGKMQFSQYMRQANGLLCTTAATNDPPPSPLLSPAHHRSDRPEIPLHTITVPGPPVPKQRPRRNARGVWYTPSRTKRYEEKVGWHARSAGLSAALTGSVKLEIRLWLPDRRRRDIDNIAKSIADGLNGVAWEDDSQVTELVVSRAGIDPNRPEIPLVLQRHTGLCLRASQRHLL
ncbi:RusA family crossover junction endodeoxyribonuclease [candidate division TA06 bacterium]|nr:RusA family crossover junction endodeoxyribonuclease [candidate division TA06 bacterium]